MKRNNKTGNPAAEAGFSFVWVHYWAICRNWSAIFKFAVLFAEMPKLFARIILLFAGFPDLIALFTISVKRHFQKSA
ncbi:hypothetical protein BBV17_11090 [Cytobacillus oceanisediminis]|uniref:Uncharacterized protein n=1 Tax=Cytobacillus oceanisediminis TaxID=665099 RepID=A0ABX3CXH2_9BACI|nr:hypothetical protein BBV17_11090 [Cytobacillus oceanisediminis]